MCDCHYKVNFFKLYFQKTFTKSYYMVLKSRDVSVFILKLSLKSPKLFLSKKDDL